MEKDNATPKGKTVGMVRPSDIGLNGKDPRKPSFCPNMLGESANRNGRESGWRRRRHRTKVLDVLLIKWKQSPPPIRWVVSNIPGACTWET